VGYHQGSLRPPNLAFRAMSEFLVNAPNDTDGPLES